MKTKSAISVDVLTYLYQNCKHLEKLFKHLPGFLNGRELSFEEIDISFLNSFKVYLSEQLMPSTVKDRMSCLRTLVKRAISAGITANDPFTEYRIKRVETDKPYFTPVQIKKLIKVSSNIHPGVVSSFFFALYTGFHRAKITKLTIAQALELPLTVKAHKLTDSIIKERKSGSLLFDNLPCITKYHLQTRIWGALAGLPVRPALEYARNTFIMNELARGLSIKEVAENLGIKELRHLLAYEKIFQTLDTTLSDRKHSYCPEEPTLPSFPLSVSERKNNFADKL